MRVLVACEFSGRVRDAFINKGHEAVSCDLLDTEIPGPHLKCNVLDVLNDNWDLIICHPPCTYLCVSGARWFKNRQIEQVDALNFVNLLLNAPIEKLALENPVGIISTKIRKPDQIIQPWQFGEHVNKKTCLWLKNLPKLIPTKIIDKKYRFNTVHEESPSKNRWKNRSRTYYGIAEAMATQWG